MSITGKVLKFIIPWTVKAIVIVVSIIVNLSLGHFAAAQSNLLSAEEYKDSMLSSDHDSVVEWVQFCIGRKLQEKDNPRMGVPELPSERRN